MRVAAAGFVALVVAGSPLAGQTREKGPWWPHPIWGPTDQAGSSNWITPDKILQSLKLVKTGKVYELGQVYESGMPKYGERSYSLTIPAPTGTASGANQIVGNDEFVAAEIGQVGTQFDGPGHIGQRIKMADGSYQDIYYNGHPWSEVGGRYGLRKLGIEHVKPIITRAVLIDIAGFKGLPYLPLGYEVTVADVRGALARQGMSEADIAPGDAILFAFGWSALWRKPAEYSAGQPGIGLEVARWVVERKPSMVGSDSPGLEVNPNPDPQLLFPVHQELITRNGIWNQENLHFEELLAERAYEFLFVFTPVRFKGATGSPGRPIAIR
ncbi:MAG: cyclase family protein [Gemmatimonadales bacterium]|nr:cyclase family protein [Gemmatimonadales bacterium]